VKNYSKSHNCLDDPESSSNGKLAKRPITFHCSINWQYFCEYRVTNMVRSAHEFVRYTNICMKYGHSDICKITISSNPLVWEVVDASFECTSIKKVGSVHQCTQVNQRDWA
jgi:hypothetical protein